jgi:hypothetical protein
MLFRRLSLLVTGLAGLGCLWIHAATFETESEPVTPALQDAASTVVAARRQKAHKPRRRVMRSAPPSTVAPQPPSDLEEAALELDTGMLVPPPPSVRLSRDDLMGEGMLEFESTAQVGEDPRYHACRGTWEARGMKYDGEVTLDILLGVDGLENVSVIKNEHDEVQTNYIDEWKRVGPVPAVIISCLSAAIWRASWPAPTDGPLSYIQRWPLVSSEKPNHEYYVE